MIKRILSHTGEVIKEFHFEDPNTLDGAVWQIKQNCDNLVRQAKLKRDMENKKDVFRSVAFVPMPVLETSMKEGWDEADWRRWLNDSDNRAFRTGGGHI